MGRFRFYRFQDTACVPADGVFLFPLFLSHTQKSCFAPENAPPPPAAAVPAGPTPRPSAPEATPTRNGQIPPPSPPKPGQNRSSGHVRKFFRHYSMPGKSCFSLSPDPSFRLRSRRFAFPVPALLLRSQKTCIASENAPSLLHFVFHSFEFPPAFPLILNFTHYFFLTPKTPQITGVISERNIGTARRVP